MGTIRAAGSAANVLALVCIGIVVQAPPCVHGNGVKSWQNNAAGEAVSTDSLIKSGDQSMRRRRESLHTITLATDDGEDDLVLELKEETDLLRRLNVRSKAPPTQSLHIFLASCAQILKETARAHYSRLQPARCTATFLRKIRMGSIANTFSQSHVQLAARRRQVESRFNLPSTRPPHSIKFPLSFQLF